MRRAQQGDSTAEGRAAVSNTATATTGVGAGFRPTPAPAPAPTPTPTPTPTTTPTSTPRPTPRPHSAPVTPKQDAEAEARLNRRKDRESHQQPVTPVGAGGIGDIDKHLEFKKFINRLRDTILEENGHVIDREYVVRWANQFTGKLWERYDDTEKEQAYQYALRHQTVTFKEAEHIFNGYLHSLGERRRYVDAADQVHQKPSSNKPQFEIPGLLG